LRAKAVSAERTACVVKPLLGGRRRKAMGLPSAQPGMSMACWTRDEMSGVCWREVVATLKYHSRGAHVTTSS